MKILFFITLVLGVVGLIYSFGSQNKRLDDLQMILAEKKRVSFAFSSTDRRPLRRSSDQAEMLSSLFDFNEKFIAARRDCKDETLHNALKRELYLLVSDLRSGQLISLIEAWEKQQGSSRDWVPRFLLKLVAQTEPEWILGRRGDVDLETRLRDSVEGEALELAFNVWPRKNLDAAVNWLQQHKDLMLKKTYDRLARQFGIAAFESNPEGSLKFLTTLDHDHHHSVDSLIPLLKEKERRESFAALIDQYTQGPLQRNLVDTLMRSALINGRLEEGTEIFQMLDDYSAKDRFKVLDNAVNSLIYRQDKIPLDTIMDWLADANSPDPIGSMRRAAATWVEYDLQAATTWINHLQEGPARDGALLALATQVDRDGDPVTAMEWASGISDSKQRADIEASVFWHWQDHDPQSANEWKASRK